MRGKKRRAKLERAKVKAGLTQERAATKAQRRGAPAKGQKRAANEQEESEEPEWSELDEAEEVQHSPGGAGKSVCDWAENKLRQERWLASRGGTLEEPLSAASGKVLRLCDFLPLEVADAVLAVIESLPEEIWELSEQGGEVDAARHRFWSVDVCDVPELASLRSVFWRMLPSLRKEPTLPIFSVGRYGASDFIDRHDDRAHVPIFNGETIYSRSVAAIWYLTRDWSEEEGGYLLDLQADEAGNERTLLPRYNSMVVFEVPHWHAVAPVTSSRYRYSIFGWWHQRGKLYDLPSEASVASGQPPAGRKVFKKKRKIAKRAAA